ncbi:MAG: PAS domain S-box protein [Chloroflexota bacterium]
MDQMDLSKNIANDEDRQLAGILSILIYASGGMFLFLSITGIFYNDKRMIVVTLLGCAALILPMVLLKRRHLRTSSLFFTLIIMGIVTFLATIGQGIRDLGIVTFPILFIFAGLALDRKYFRLCIGLALVAIGWLSFGETFGWFTPVPFTEGNWIYLIEVTILLLIAALAVDLLAMNLRRNLEQARTEVVQRKQAEEALLQAKEYAENLIHTANVMIVGLDVSGNITVFNKAAEVISGYTRTDLEGKNWFETLVPRNKYTQVWEEFTRLSQGGMPESFENPILTKSGEERQIAWQNSTLWEQGSATGTISFGLDITERKRSEVALRESQGRVSEALEFNRKILETSSIGIMTYEKSGQCTLANAAAARAVGATVDKLLTQNFHKITSWKQSGMYQAATRALDTGNEQWLEVPVLTTFGKDAWLNLSFSSFDSGGEQQLLVFMSDVTESKRADQKIVASETKLRALFAAMKDVVIVYDTDGRYIEIAPTNPANLIHPPDEMLGKTVLEVLPKEQATFVLAKIGEALQTRTVVTGEYSMQIDNRMVWFAVSVSPLSENTVIWVAYEITERKRFDVVQNAIYRITQTAITSEGIAVLYHSIHSILGELIPAENFYIALYNAVTGFYSFPYFVDQYDEPPTESTKIAGLTGFVLRTGCPLLASREVYDRLVQQGEVEVVGTVPMSWIGTPLKAEDRTIGVMAVQSYIERVHFTQQDLDLLGFVSAQVAQAIERKRLEEEIRNLSLTDELTGLYNRRGFMLLAEHEVRLAKRLKRAMLLFFGDVDGLKMINDTHGHAQGDLALKDISAILKKTFRETDIMARLGGDEFVVLNVDASMESAELLVNRIQAALNGCNQQGDRPYQLSLSLGISRYDPEAPCTVSELIAQADGRMYQQKQEKQRIK